MVKRSLPWRELLARLPLPMLALSAAWGVWQFQQIFTPWYVALMSAAAFELVYLALAFAETPDRRRAAVISVAAVVVSVLYNTLSSLFHIRPALLTARPLWADILLAVLHGIPLAVVAYAVADLLLHRPLTLPVTVSAPLVSMSAPRVSAPVLALTDEAPAADTLTAESSQRDRVSALARERGVSERTIWRKVKAGELSLS